jgi:L-ascorbate metabolism protein UlaG (beta-lactamase superfamily)
MTEARHEFAAGVIGGSATVIDYGHTRLVSDPVFSPPGRQGGLTKLTSPALPPEQLGDVDAVLLSHDDAGAAGLLALAPLGTWTLTTVPAIKPGPATKPETSS